jgi:hypothetical protein
VKAADDRFYLFSSHESYESLRNKYGRFLPSHA